MTPEEITAVIKQATKDAVFNECDGTWSGSWERVSLYEKHGDVVEKMAERIGEFVAKRFLEGLRIK